jgi:hypothetical protein
MCRHDVRRGGISSAGPPGCWGGSRRRAVMGWRVSYHQAGAPSTGSTRCQGEDHSRLAQAGTTAGGPRLPCSSAGCGQPPEQQVFLVALHGVHAGGRASEVRGRWRRTVKQRRDYGRRSGGMDGGMGRRRMEIKLAGYSAISRSPLSRL